MLWILVYIFYICSCCVLLVYIINLYMQNSLVTVYQDAKGTFLSIPKKPWKGHNGLYIPFKAHHCIKMSHKGFISLMQSSTLGCSDFDCFHILRYNNPSLTPYGSQDLEIGKKKISTSSMACGNFWQKTGKCVFWYDFKV